MPKGPTTVEQMERMHQLEDSLNEAKTHLAEQMRAYNDALAFNRKPGLTDAERRDNSSVIAHYRQERDKAAAKCLDIQSQLSEFKEPSAAEKLIDEVKSSAGAGAARHWGQQMHAQVDRIRARQAESESVEKMNHYDALKEGRALHSELNGMRGKTDEQKADRDALSKSIKVLSNKKSAHADVDQAIRQVSEIIARNQPGAPRPS